MHTTDAPFVDTSADDLTRELGLEDIPALAMLMAGRWSCVYWAHPIRCESGLDRNGGWPPSAPGRLPESFTASRYNFTSQVQELARAQLKTKVEAIKSHVSKQPHGLAVMFQGDPLALTGLMARIGRRAVSWRTWHVYPQNGQIVRTESWLTGLG